jgi:hypothetical protein
MSAVAGIITFGEAFRLTLLAVIFWGMPALQILLYRRHPRTRLSVPGSIKTIPLGLAALMASLAIHSGYDGNWKLAVLFAGSAGMQFYVWWIADGNDRWRKLKQRIVEHVAALGSRLAVVPA